MRNARRKWLTALVKPFGEHGRAFCRPPLLVPSAVRPLPQLRIIILAVARHFFSDKGQAEIGLVFGGQFYFCHREAGIFAEKLVYLIDMLACGHYPANLVDDARLPQPQEGESFVLGDFFFKFLARQSTLPRRAFDGEISLVVA